MTPDEAQDYGEMLKARQETIEHNLSRAFVNLQSSMHYLESASKQAQDAHNEVLEFSRDLKKTKESLRQLGCQ